VNITGVPSQGAKSRVETQIKLGIQLVNQNNERIGAWTHIKLPEYMVAKEKNKSVNAKNVGTYQLFLIFFLYVLGPVAVALLEAAVVCQSDKSKVIQTCTGCVLRERKRAQRKKNIGKKKAGAAATPVIEDDEPEVMALEQRKILLFNCTEIAEFTSGELTLPTRITCYCRHHGEKQGFCIQFVLRDYANNVVAVGISPPIMITDDHKASKVKKPEAGAVPTKKSSTKKSADATNQVVTLTPPSSPLSPGDEVESEVDMGTPEDDDEEEEEMSRLIPNQGPCFGGIEITVLGANFYAGLTAMFDSTPALPTQFWSPNTLICILPPRIQPGTTVVTFKEHPSITLPQAGDMNEMMLFTYVDESDKALMELALQVVGLKMTGRLEDARNIALRIVGSQVANGQQQQGQQQQGQQQQGQQHQNTLDYSTLVRDLILSVINLARRDTGHRLLHLGAMKGFERLVDALADMPDIEVDALDMNGYSALHYACWRGQAGSAKVLIDKG
ncbi:hypothetical protein BKA57DRAFT_371404, partial [Linnemannia elongata]